jgi:hypothetical protein
MINSGLNGATSPGEHHFVSAYLIPKLFAINGIVPDYINPDGTKEIIGDVVYFIDGVHNFGIEVKFQTIRLTKNEFNSWIVNEDTSDHPELFIGIGTEGVIILSWHEFRNAYIKSAGITNLEPIIKGYGPQKSVNTLYAAGDGAIGYLPKANNETDANENELQFVQLLQDAISR